VLANIFGNVRREFPNSIALTSRRATPSTDSTSAEPDAMIYLLLSGIVGIKISLIVMIARGATFIVTSKIPT
jgi:hypothetical protein